MAVNPVDFLVKNGLVVSTTATILSTSNAYSTTTGALTVAGGAGIQQDLYIGGKLYVGGDTSLGGIAFGPATSFPPVEDPNLTATYYDAVTTASIIFSDGTIQATRAPTFWTNAMFISMAANFLTVPHWINVFKTANGYQGDPTNSGDVLAMAGLLFYPSPKGGAVNLGDTYFDDGTFGGTPGHIYIMTDQGAGTLQFLDITPPVI